MERRLLNIWSFRGDDLECFALSILEIALISGEDE
jgi:hypothetical protein